MFCHARPVLVNVSSFRNIVAFGLSFKMVSWVEQIGYLVSHMRPRKSHSIACSKFIFRQTSLSQHVLGTRRGTQAE